MVLTVSLPCFGIPNGLAIKYFDIVLSIDSADIKAKTFREEAIKRLDFYNKNMEL